MTNCSASNRPTHSNLASFLRSLQMSNKRLFVFVEGTDNDPFFYGSLCSVALSGTNILYVVMNSKNIPECSAGKKGLIDLFNYLNSKSSLFSNHKGKKTGILFFLDKDIDDLTDVHIDSDHVVYTYYYEVENHIIEHGDLRHGCAVAASIDPQELAKCIGDTKEWLKNTAYSWIDWVNFCVFSKMAKLDNCPLNYNRPSQFNNQSLGTVNQAEYQRCLAIIKSESGLSDSEFLIEFKRISQIVKNLYEKGEYGKVFKGKWYKYFLNEHIRQLAKTTSGNVDGFEKHIFRYISGSLDFHAAWANHFVRPLQKIISKLA